MEETDKIIKLISPDNITRKWVFFKNGEITVKRNGELFHYPEVIIVKNNNGHMVFNAMVEYLDYREKILPFEKNWSYPYYVLTMDSFSSGGRFGFWEMFQSLEELADIVDVSDWRDDFEGLKETVTRIIMP